MLGGIERGRRRLRNRRCGAARPARGAREQAHAAAARDADALAVLLDLDFGQAGFVEQLASARGSNRGRRSGLSAILPLRGSA